MKVETFMTRAKDMLAQDAAIFEHYGELHRAKIARWQEELDRCQIPMRANELRALILDTTQKAESNENRAKVINDFLIDAGGGIVLGAGRPNYPAELDR